MYKNSNTYWDNEQFTLLKCKTTNEWKLKTNDGDTLKYELISITEI